MYNGDLSSKEYDGYYGRYIDKVSPKQDLREGFEVGRNTVKIFFESISTDKQEYRYDNNKWSPKEILQHLIDTERVFMYRCFRIARNDKTSLAGYDQNIYVDPSGANQKSMTELISEFEIVRQSSISFIKSVTDYQLAYIGNASGGDMSARAAAFTIIGHEIWHIDIIKERYLV
ncbi:DinB family protein [Aquimarina sp. AD1]|uniref:DinB family protein n=1 Tax=Aquimarina sp. (strain AD1) TaxID=1714848 RepID=UPI000E51F8BD|nr:DinB family protein [Aquimarina sp. AD1]AXT54433.1 DinB family protein [Aquimarina sp. AD1]RKN36733.1 DinB family protein [Aquimarina sp. AD1]